MHFGAAWPYPFGFIVHAKVTDAQTVRKIALEGHRFAPSEALKSGLVDHIVAGDTEDVLAKAQEVAQVVSANAQTGAWGLIRVSIVVLVRGSDRALMSIGQSDLYAGAVKALTRTAEHKRRTVAQDDADAKARL